MNPCQFVANIFNFSYVWQFSKSQARRRVCKGDGEGVRDEMQKGKRRQEEGKQNRDYNKSMGMIINNPLFSQVSSTTKLPKETEIKNTYSCFLGKKFISSNLVDEQHFLLPSIRRNQRKKSLYSTHRSEKSHLPVKTANEEIMKKMD